MTLVESPLHALLLSTTLLFTVLGDCTVMQKLSVVCFLTSVDRNRLLPSSDHCASYWQFFAVAHCCGSMFLGRGHGWKVIYSGVLPLRVVPGLRHMPFS